MMRALSVATVCMIILSMPMPALAVKATASATTRAPVVARFAVNQAGYVPGWPQHAVAIDLKPGAPVSLIDVRNGATLRRWRATSSRVDPDSGMRVTALDLPALRPGRYLLRAQGVEPASLQVAPQALDAPVRSLLRAYFLQRCGVALNDAETGLQHGPDHLDDGVLAHPDALHPQPGALVVAIGGWHDAGDFGKYVATTSVTVGRLLSLYTGMPGQFADGQLNIPESGNGIPDILDETRVGLDWMLSMQRADGALYRKVSGARWPEPITPDHDVQTRYVYGVSSPDTAKAAAAFALAARVYKPFAPALAARYLDAAIAAWQWLGTVHTPQYIDAYPGDDSGSGPYMASAIDREPSLMSDADDRVWAAAELWLTTGDEQYVRVIEREPALTATLDVFEWKNPASLGLLHLLGAPADMRLPEPLRQRIGRALQNAAGHAFATSRSSGFELANRRFVWGSNKLAAEEGVLLATAYRYGGDPRFLRAATAQLDFVFGVNPFGLSFVSGVGERAVQHPAHLFGRVAGRPIPGLFVGGPNDEAQDGVAPRGLELLSYVDDARAYSVNEFAIDYNASLLGLIGALQQAQAERPRDRE